MVAVKPTVCQHWYLWGTVLPSVALINDELSTKYQVLSFTSLGYRATLPRQCWKSEIQALPQVIGFSPKCANSLSQSVPNLCSDSQVFLGTIRLARAITWHSLWAWLWLSLCLCLCRNAKISLFCTSKSSLTASYFCLIVLNLLSLHVQLPQTKATFPAPKYCHTSPSERIVCCRISGCKQNQRWKGRFERARLIGWSKTRKMRATWWSFGVKQYELGQCFARHESRNTDEWV